MIKLYHSPNARSLRIIWLLEEMHVDYEIVRLDSPDTEQLREKLAEPAFRSISPLGLLPVIEDDDGGEAKAVFESAAIMDYVFEVYGNRGLRPEKGTESWFTYNQWFHSVETLLGPFEQVSLHLSDLPEDLRNPAIAEFFMQRCHAYYSVLEEILQNQSYIAGEFFTAADIMLAYLVLMVSHSGAIGNGMYPAIEAYEARLLERPALQKTMHLQEPEF
jgi:glutathione S-transferase